MTGDLKDKLLKLCQSSAIKLPSAVTIPEPYIPFIPSNWNGCLVLAEAQNHSKRNDAYLSWLTELTSEDRMLRLYELKDKLGCQPWDDGSLKFATACISDDEPERWAVCNAVLWSRRSSSGSNDNPSKCMKENSVRLWEKYLKVLHPELIVAAGKVAREVIDKAGYTGDRLNLWLPSPLNLQRLATLFDTDDLLKRYPEAESKLAKYETLIMGKGRNNKFFYACHAVSMARKHKVGINE